MRQRPLLRICSLSILLTLFTPPGPMNANPGPIAEVLCAPTEKMRHRLKRQFGAHLAWQGLRGPDQIMELWEDARGEWTLVIAYTTGRVCIVAMGTEITGFLDERPKEPPA